MRKIIIIIVSMICVVQTIAQNRTISGNVTSKEDGQALPGVNVVVKGTNDGTITTVF